MAWLDVLIITVIAVSTVASAWRGFVREALSLAGWVVAFWVAFAFTGPAAAALDGYIGLASARMVLAFVGLLVGALIVVGAVNWVLQRLLSTADLSATDRLLGALFGLARGALVVLVLVLVAGLTEVPGAPWWQRSVLVPVFERAAVWSARWLPGDLGAELRY